ncbi:hypothetical protein IC762_17855 [Bradyrhizobium genosp. L]|uniref:hypothetical protein n=1 Tax=Bradyrhizobium genosp. L TaxID=83637 RepID=UPI0018A2DC21|nr:hypothetical protein [Bradyrhizobium genosp. L]QPF81688.1 hypothetical protein IC762_17855 [Bradyrhizobium genosp. L]
MPEIVNPALANAGAGPAAVPQPRSSQDAIDLIVREEDSSPEYYARHYTHFEWPLGASGPTVGIGYDCGYSTAAQIKSDWTGFVADDVVTALQRAAGLTGEAAHQWVRAHGGSVTITWNQAIAQFRAHELLKWEHIVSQHLPGSDKLNGDCFGAITSIAYNRGPSFDAPGPRYAEMRSIKAHVASGNLAAVPGDILSMRRLWPKGGDLWNRRVHEAALFTQGLRTAGIA